MTTAKLKNVLITGATDGLGKAAALFLAQHGYRVFAAGRSAEKRRQLDDLARQQSKISHQDPSDADLRIIEERQRKMMQILNDL